ncbi:MAG: sulfatase-like hydrolase/transferase [Muribaculaceae bacterium]|nr:sulfatase-like hydrolase/transferase [Muribaculaceae bacterium]
MKTTNRIAFSVLSALTALPAFQAQAADSGKSDVQKRPNVILLVADDLGYGDMECYGAKNIETPNVNRLASEGIRFTNCHATASTSTPSRYGLLTGEYAWRRSDTDVVPGNSRALIRPDQYTIADMFHDNGYFTGAIGKWHLGLGEVTGEQDWNGRLTWTPRDIGFDYHYIQAATADRVPCVYLEQDTVANYDPTAPISVSYSQNFTGEPTGKSNPELLKLMYSHGHDQSIVDGISRIGYMKGGGKALWKDENIADSIADHSRRFIFEHKDEPFFLYLCTNDPHVPRWPHERFRGKNVMGLRGDALASFDWTVGQVLDALDEAGVADNTLIILTSDNGPVLDDGYVDQAVEKLNGHSPAGPFRGYKYSGFEGGTMVPFIVRWPDAINPSEETNNTLMSHIDLFASFGELIGAELPAGAARDSGNSLDQLLGRSMEHRPWVSELNNSRTLCVRTDRWKFIPASSAGKTLGWPAMGVDGVIETANDPKDQLYDMVNDPGETTNVAADNPEIVKMMKAVWRDASSVEFTPPTYSTPTDEHWYAITTPLRDNRCVSVNASGFLHGMDQSNGYFPRGQWKFVEREDGTCDIISRLDGNYVNPVPNSDGRFSTVSAVPEKGWRIDYAMNSGLVVFYTDDLSAQLNQTTLAGNSYRVINWGGGRHDDAGCQFLLTEMTGGTIPEIKMPTTKSVPAASTADNPRWFTICAPLRSSYYTGVSPTDGLVGQTATYLLPNLVWRFEARADGTYNIYNMEAKKYVKPQVVAGGRQFELVDEEPDNGGWTFKAAKTSGYYIITSGKLQFNQSETSNGWKIINWGDGTNTSDIGCQFRFTDVSDAVAQFTDLVDITAPDTRSGVYHDLLGRPVANPGHGIFIAPGGRKVIL